MAKTFLSELLQADLKHQSVEIGDGPEPKGETRARRAGRYPGRLVTHLLEDALTLYENFQQAVTKYGNNPCLGTRKKEDENKLGPYQWETYQEVGVRVKNFASGLRKHGIIPGAKIGIYSKNTPEWFITEHACNSQSFITVAIYDTFGPEVIGYVLNHAEVEAVITAPEGTSKLIPLLETTPKLKLIIQTGASADAEKWRSEAERLGVTFKLFSEVEAEGKEQPVEATPPKPEDLAVIMYTSGTTGMPKGVMHSHKGLISTAAAVTSVINGVSSQDCYISFLPLAHILEREALTAMVTGGASIGFYSGDVKNLTSDILALKPTLLTGVPRVFDRIYAKITSTVQNDLFLKRWLFNTAYESKKSLQKSGIKGSIWDSIVFSSVKAKLGGRVRLILSGGAPLSAATQQFLAICFCCPVVQGYGLTETCAGGCVTLPDDSDVGHVGPPVPCAEIKLVDVDDMNYFTSSNPPAGEVCIRGPCVSHGYFKDPEKTAQDFDKEGWFHTGDVGRWNANGTLSIIDRKKNIFKLAQGEYVAAEKLELIYSHLPIIQQIFVYGDSYQSVLVAVIVPEPSQLSSWAAEKKITGDIEALCANEAVKKGYLEELAKVAKGNKLNGFEFIKGVHLHPREFSIEEDLLTPTMKLKRPQLKSFFKEQIDGLYVTLNATAEK